MKPQTGAGGIAVTIAGWKSEKEVITMYEPGCEKTKTLAFLSFPGTFP